MSTSTRVISPHDRLFRYAFGALFLCFAAVLTAVFILERARGHATVPDPEAEFVRRIYGSPEAPVSLIVYNDFECRYCKVFHQRIFPDLKRQYGDRISVEYRHFPLPRHPVAWKEAEAAECVARELGEDGFWRFSDAMFRATPSENGFEVSRLPEVAASVGADRDAFSRCMQEGGGKETVLAHINAGVAEGIDVTPTIIIRGAGEEVRVERAYPGLLTTGIDYILARGSAASPHVEQKDEAQGL